MKILLFIPNGLGDVLMAFPAINELLEKQKIFAVVVQNKIQTAVLRQKFGNNFKIFERFDGRPFSQFRLLLQIRKFNPAAIYAPLAANKFLNVIFFLLTNSKVYLPGVAKKQLFNIHYMQYSLSTYNGHQVNYILDFLTQFKTRSHVHPKALLVKNAATFDVIDHDCSNSVMLAVGLSCGEDERHKIPRPRFFSDVVNKLKTFISAEITVFVFGVGNDSLLIKDFIDQLDSKIKIDKLMDAPLEQVFLQLGKCDLGIAGTTGQGHMMAAVDLPMVVLGGVTNPAESGPYCSIQRVVSHSYQCGPCYSVTNRRGCGYQCMEDINPETAARELADLYMSKRLLND